MTVELYLCNRLIYSADNVFQCSRIFFILSYATWIRSCPSWKFWMEVTSSICSSSTIGTSTLQRLQVLTQCDTTALLIHIFDKYIFSKLNNSSLIEVNPDTLSLSVRAFLFSPREERKWLITKKRNKPSPKMSLSRSIRWQPRYPIVRFCSWISYANLIFS